MYRLKMIYASVLTVAMLGIVKPIYAADVRLATAPLWSSFNSSIPFARRGNCTAVNLHNRDIKLTTTAVYHNDDRLPYPIPPDTLSISEVTQTLGPGEATAVGLDDPSSDTLLYRCEFRYKGNPNKVKAAVVLDDSLTGSVTSLPAELVSK